jgi:TM2 domain-containing membrane protein YozV
MRKLLVILFLIPITSVPQSTSFDFQSPQNIKKFADYLFCEGDYLRAAEEYTSIRNIFQNDTINLKIMLSYSNLNLYNQVFESYLKEKFSKFREDAQMHYLKNSFLVDSSVFRSSLSQNSFPFKMDLSVANYFLKLRSVYFIETLSNEIIKEDLLKPFDALQRREVEPFIDLSASPDYRSPALAGILSAVIPGSGKMYVGDWGDGITSLLLTGLFAFLAYDNFNADHTTRAWIFTGIGAFFYAGNIYGSIASAQIFNAKIDFDFSNGLKLFLEQRNYFLPDYDFCN